MKQINSGLSKKVTTTVTKDKLASSVGSGTVDVYSTPMMIALMENAAMKCIENELDAGETSVGTHIDVKHLSASPLGIDVYAVATVTEVDGRKVSFHIEAFDSACKIGEATHTRYVMNQETFQAKAKSKLNV